MRNLSDTRRVVLVSLFTYLLLLLIIFLPTFLLNQQKITLYSVKFITGVTSPLIILIMIFAVLYDKLLYKDSLKTDLVTCILSFSIVPVFYCIFGCSSMLSCDECFWAPIMCFLGTAFCLMHKYGKKKK